MARLSGLHYARDVARAFCLAARYTGAPRVFNIGSGLGISVNELLATIEAVLGQTVRRGTCRAAPSMFPSTFSTSREPPNIWDGVHSIRSRKGFAGLSCGANRPTARAQGSNRRLALADRTVSE